MGKIVWVERRVVRAISYSSSSSSSVSPDSYASSPDPSSDCAFKARAPLGRVVDVDQDYYYHHHAE
jgi:hypothetical protein